MGIRHIFSALLNISNETSGGPLTSSACLFLLEAGASDGLLGVVPTCAESCGAISACEVPLCCYMSSYLFPTF